MKAKLLNVVLWLVSVLSPMVLDLAARWAKEPTRQLAYRLRLRTKTLVLAGKAKARQTEGKADDLPYGAADIYTGLATMRAAQQKLAEALVVVGEPVSAMHYQLRALLEEASRILDEPDDWVPPEGFVYDE